MSAVLELHQGSEAWHEHRAAHRNASDAPAMMGVSPYETRAQLLRRLHTGIVPEVDAATQRRFDIGHRAEALCRPLAEGLLEEELAPRVVTNGLLSASLDGQTLLCDIDWEHKALNADLREVLPAKGIGGPEIGARLPAVYRVQMAQQQHCSGAARTLFSASLWTTDGALVEARHCWYERDEALIAQVLAGWRQLEADLNGFVPPEATPAAVAAPLEHLPAVSVQVSGALAVVSNLADMAPRLRAFIARIPASPSTDQEFADVEAACKRLREVQSTIEGKVRDALAGIADVNELQRLGREMAEVARTAAIAGEGAVKRRKDELRLAEVERGRRALAVHIAEIDAHLGGRYMPAPAADFGAAIKGLGGGKDPLASIRNAIDTTLAQAKIAADAMGQRIMDNLHTMLGAGPEAQSLFNDRAALVLKDAEAVAAIVAQRVADRKAARDSQRQESEGASALAHQTAVAPSAGAQAEGAAAASAAAAPGSRAAPITIGALCELVAPAGGFHITQPFLESLGVPVTREKASKLVDQAAAKAALLKRIGEAL